tara:strand:- start:860 stop:2482 length:1623 start_codon:yes stop_codon:yes gene_type:complete
MKTTPKPLKYYLKDKKLNKVEKDKSEKDGLEVGPELEEFARLGWEDIDKTDLQLRLKWYGMFWRPKTPGKFMLRLRIPNGVLNSVQLSIIASIVARYGENGSCDITTRQNLQLRGILISDLPEILKRLKMAGIDTIQSGFDNPRNVTGNPLAGVDPEEVIDTRPYTYKLNEFLTSNGQGNPDFSNLPRKWNTAVAGASDNFLLHNDLVFHPVFNNGELGFSIWVGGILSSVLNDYAIPLNAWIKEEQICELTQTILTIWRDNGERSARPKGRFRSYLNQIGIEKFRTLVEEKFGQLKEDPGSQFNTKPRSFFGIHNQKQEGKYYAGIHVPVGRLTSNDLQDLSDLIKNYGTEELRLTEDQNIIIIDIPEEKLFNFKNENLLIKFPLSPNKVSAGTVSCTGNTYCGFALVNTKDQALEMSKELDKELILPEELKIHWTGCPNSCGQAYMGAIGLTGKKAKDQNGKTVEAFDISMGGRQGPVNKVGTLHKKSIPISELKDTLKQLLIDNYNALPRKKSKYKSNDFFSNFMNWFSELGESSSG